MEPVIFPKTLAPRIQADRVQRAKSRGDSGQNKPFSNPKRQEKEASSGSPSSARENSEFSSGAFAAETPATGNGHAILPPEKSGSNEGQKRIDVRV